MTDGRKCCNNNILDLDNNNDNNADIGEIMRDKDSNDCLFAYVGKSTRRQEIKDKFKQWCEDEGSTESLELFRLVKQHLEKIGRM